MAQKVLKNFSKATIIEEYWEKSENVLTGRSAYRCVGKIMNTGVTEIFNIIVLGGVYKFGDKKPVDYIDKNFRKHKLYGFKAIPVLNPGETTEFELYIDIPVVKRVLTKKAILKKLDDMLEKKRLEKKIDIFYDKKRTSKDIEGLIQNVDEEDRYSIVKEVEGTVSFKLKGHKWSYETKKYSGNEAYVLYVDIENAGSIHAEDVYVVAYLAKEKGDDPLEYKQGMKVVKAMGVYKISYLNPGVTKNVAVVIDFPVSRIIPKDVINAGNIDRFIDEGQLYRNVEIVYRQASINEEGIKRLNLANSYTIVGDFKEALNKLREALILLPNEERIIFNLGMNYYKKGEFENAQRSFHKAAEINPSSEKAKYFEGLSNIKAEKYNEAMECFAAIPESSNIAYKAYYNIACIFFKVSKVDGGFDWLERAIMKNRSTVLPRMKRDPDLTEVRKGDPRFAEMVERYK